MSLFDLFRRKFASAPRPTPSEPAPPPANAQPKLLSVEEAAAASQTLGWVIILLNETPPREPAAFNEWAMKHELQAAGLRVRTEDTFSIGAGKHDALVYVGAGPFPAERLADLGAPKDLDPGQGFIGLSLGLPGMAGLARSMNAAYDPWAANGQMRDLSRIASELSKHGPAVILPQAGTLFGAEAFRARLENLEDLASRPFASWIGLSVDRELGAYSSFGMVLQALPNVFIEVDGNDEWELNRAREAILVACSTMVHENRALQPDEQIDVPVGQPVGAGPLERIAGDAEVYKVELVKTDSPAATARGAIRLRRVDAAGVRAAWARNPEGGRARIALNTYQELLRISLSSFLDTFQIAGLSPTVEGDNLPFDVDVWEARGGDGFFMTTSGVGRVAQRFGQSSRGTDHVEFVAAMQAHHPLIANAVAAIACSVHLQSRADELFKPGDTIGLAVPEIGAAGFVLGDAGSISIAGGPRIHLLELIPAKQTEYEQARVRGSTGFRELIGKMSPASRAARWKLLLS